MALCACEMRSHPIGASEMFGVGGSRRQVVGRLNVRMVSLKVRSVEGVGMDGGWWRARGWCEVRVPEYGAAAAAQHSTASAGLFLSRRV